MSRLIETLFLLLPLSLMSSTLLAQGDVKIVSSPENRVALLELYTSEGCSSCPPADRFLSSLKEAGIPDTQLIPMAFHVTYWDYIGWSDRFAKKQFDQRQRSLAKKNRQKTIYTPQFILGGDDFRRYRHFSEDVSRLASQRSAVDLVLSSHWQQETDNRQQLQLLLKSDISDSDDKTIDVYIAVTENNLSSNIDAGENSGEELHHDFVVRQLMGPVRVGKKEPATETRFDLMIPAQWRRQNLSVVAFAEESESGEVLQAVRLNLKETGLQK